MPKKIVLAGGKDVESQTFVDEGGDELLVRIEDRHYRVHKTPEDTFYSMTKIGQQMHSVKGPTLMELEVKLARIHMAWRRYEKQIQTNKNALAAERDREISRILSE
jgi:hypothetical protein